MEILLILVIIVTVSAIIIFHELGHFAVAKWAGIFVEEFGLGYPPRALGKKIGETLYSINWIPFGGFVKFFHARHSDNPNNLSLDRSYEHYSIWKRMAMVLGGIIMNFLVGWILISIVFMIGIPKSILITDVAKGGIAEVAGIKSGDQLMDLKDGQELINLIDSNKGKEISLRIKRENQDLTFKVTPRVVVPKGEGNLGISMSEAGLAKTGFLRSFWEGAKMSAQLCREIFLGFITLFSAVFSNITLLNNFVGPVGIINPAVQTAKLGAVYLIQLLGMISLNLAVFNLFPLPALDGGWFLFLVIEKLRGKPLAAKTERIFNSIGFSFLFLILIGITIKDIVKLF